MDKKMRLKVLKQLRNEAVSINELSKMVKFRTRKNLQTFVDTINYMYSKDEVVVLTENQEKKLILR